MTIGTKIAAAFLKAQSEMGNATKDSSNPYFKSKYADLNAVREACLPALNKHGICVLQPTVQIDSKNYVKTILLHESGETIEALTEVLFGKPNDPQAQGSGITYARRYGLQSLVNIGAEDDDGNKAAEKPKTDKQKLANISDIDMKETLLKENKKLTERLVAKIKSFGSVSELEGWLEDKAVKSAYNKLAKHYTDGMAEITKAESDFRNEYSEQ